MFRPIWLLAILAVPLIAPDSIAPPSAHLALAPEQPAAAVAVPPCGPTPTDGCTINDTCAYYQGLIFCIP